MSLRVGAVVATLCAVLPGAWAGAQRPAPAAAQRQAPDPALPVVHRVVGLAPDTDVERVVVSPGRARPLTLGAPVTRVMVADTSIADAIVVSDRDVVFSGRKFGETDVLVWSGGRRLHYRTVVTPAADRQQIMLAVKFAEVRRDLLKNIGLSLRARRVTGRDATGGNIGAFDPAGVGGYLPQSTTTGGIASVIPSAVSGVASGFGTLVTDFGARGVLAMLDLEEQRGNAHTLAEPTLMAANRDSASFLAGGEFPVPAAVSPGVAGTPYVTIVFKEFGVRLAFTPEVLNDTLVQLHVRPEVSSLDYSNAVTLSGVKIPALRTRRMESTIDVPRDQSLIISGLMDDEREKVRTGIPGLINLPILGQLFSSTRWTRSETELLVIVTPVVVDPSRPRAQDVLRFRADTVLPAHEVLDRRLAVPPSLPGSTPTTPTPTPTTPTPTPTTPSSPNAPSTATPPVPKQP
ncbi:MAG TPA: pilus assembly protein N-terminal domain-containing protein [Gemmatirosa sp.]